MNRFYVWTKKNWKWLLPFLLLLFSLSIGIAFITVKNSYIYRQSLDLVRKNDYMSDVLGKPIEPGWWFTGKIKYGPSGIAWLTFPVSGSKSKGKVVLFAVKDKNQWRFNELFVEMGEGKCFDLLKNEMTVCNP